MRPHRMALAVIVVVFAASRVAAYAAGIRFDAEPLTTYWQYIDTVLLKERLLESLYYLHSQPPLFNLLLGVTLKAFPASYATALQLQFIAMGLVSTLAFYALLIQLGVSKTVGTVTTVCLCILPVMVLYENWLFYEYPTLMLLLLASVALHRCLARDSVPAGIAFFGLAAALIFLRSVFQFMWLFAIVAVLIAVKPRRFVFICSAVPLAIVALLYAKNVVLFGTTATSSWLGMNLARATVSQLDQESLDTFVKAGTLHQVSSIPPFSAPGAYADLVDAVPQRGVPVLDNPLKADGGVNFNASTYLPISREYLADALWVMRNRTDVYRETVIEDALPLLFSSASEFALVEENRRKIETYDRIVGDYLYVYSPHWRRIGLGVIAAYVFAIGYAAVLIVGIARERRLPGADTLTILFVVATCSYIAMVTSLTEVGENQRMRFIMDPPIIACVTAGVVRLFRPLYSR